MADELKPIRTQADYEKHALLTLAHWVGFWFTGSQVRNGFAIDILQQWFHSHLSR